MKLRNPFKRSNSDQSKAAPHTSPDQHPANTPPQSPPKPTTTAVTQTSAKPITPPKRKEFSESGVILDYFRSIQTKTDSKHLIDVGAFKGGTLKPYLKLGWKVDAFEPDPAKHDALFKLASDPNLKVWTCALSDEPKPDLPFYTSPESPGISSLLKFRGSHDLALHVPVKTLAHISTETTFDHIDYMKIDAEGHDLLVLQGNNWDQVVPDVVMCEFEDAKTHHLDYTYDELGDYLVSKGYEVWMSEWNPIVRYGIQHQWKSVRKYPCEISNKDGWGNFIAAQPHAAEALSKFIEPFMPTDDNTV